STLLAHGLVLRSQNFFGLFLLFTARQAESARVDIVAQIENACFSLYNLFRSFRDDCFLFEIDFSGVANQNQTMPYVLCVNNRQQGPENKHTDKSLHTKVFAE